MKKTLIIWSLVSLFVFPCFGVHAAINTIGDTFVISYEISLNEQNKGYMEIHFNGDRFKTTYYHITQNDRIPFYAGSKSGVLENRLYAAELEFDGRRFTVYNDLTRQAPERLPSFLNTQTARESRAVLVNQSTGNIDLSFDKIPMVTQESIISGFLYNTIQIGKPMMLYEIANNIQMKIFLQHEENINPSSCMNARYSCFRESIPDQPPQFLFDVVVNKDGIPIAFASRSRWAYNIERIGQIREERKNITPYLAERAVHETKQKFMHANAKIENLRASNFTAMGNESYRYDYNIDIRFIPDANPLQESLKYLRNRGFPDSRSSIDEINHIKTSDDNYYVAAEKTEVCNALKNINSLYRNCETIPRNGQTILSLDEFLGFAEKEMPGESLLIESFGEWTRKEDEGLLPKFSLFRSEDKGLKSVKNLSRRYIEQNFPAAEYRGIIIHREEKNIGITDEDGTTNKLLHERPKSIEINYVHILPIPENDVLKAAENAIYNKLFGHSTNFPRANMYLERVGPRKFTLSVSKQTINEIIKNQRHEAYRAAATRANISEYTIADRNGLYRLTGHGSFSMRETNDFILAKLIREHPRLNYTQHEIIKGFPNWTFPIISSELNICR